MRSFLANPKFMIVLLLLFAGVVFWAWVFFVLSGGTLRARADILEIEREIKKLEEKQNLARASAKILEKRKSDLERVDRFSPSSRQPLELIERLENAASQTGNKISLALPGSEKESGPLGFRLTLDGSQKSIGQYLAALSLLPYEIKIRDLAFQKVAESLRQSSRADASSGSHRMVLLIEVTTR